MTNIANIIKQIRRRNNLTQNDFASKVGISRSAIALIETNKNNPSLELVEKISSAFSITNEEKQILNNVGVSTGGNVVENTDFVINSNNIDLKNDSENSLNSFLIGSYEELINIDNTLECMCSILNAHTNYDFKKEEIKQLQQIRKTKDLLTTLMFDSVIVENHHFTIIKSTISLGKELVDNYTTELYYLMGGRISDYNNLLAETI